MNFIFFIDKDSRSLNNSYSKRKKSYSSITGGVALSLLIFFGFSPFVMAGDPFRNTNPRDIDTKTESAFKALFEEGNYTQAKEYLKEVDRISDPLTPALRASLAYTNQDWENLALYAQKTIDTANSIASKDPLRSNLYLAVGNFLVGASEYQTKGAIAAITRLQAVFDYFDRAARIDNSDPELNLIKGYLNLFLAVNLPFSNPQQAIDNLQTYAAPQYLVNRGIAVAYRDLQKYDLALEFVNKAIESTPLNPELYYLRGQILREKGNKENNVAVLQEALKNFDIALVKINQLPNEGVQKPLQREKRKTEEKIKELTTNSMSVD